MAGSGAVPAVGSGHAVFRVFPPMAHLEYAAGLLQLQGPLRVDVGGAEVVRNHLFVQRIFHHSGQHPAHQLHEVCADVSLFGGLRHPAQRAALQPDAQAGAGEHLSASLPVVGGHRGDLYQHPFTYGRHFERLPGPVRPACRGLHDPEGHHHGRAVRVLPVAFAGVGLHYLLCRHYRHQPVAV